MIELTDNEKKWILVCKGHFNEQYPSTGYWHNTMKPLWAEMVGWNPDEDNNYNDYLRGVFNKLLSIMLKIKDEWSSENGQLEELFDDVFNKKWLKAEESLRLLQESNKRESASLQLLVKNCFK